MKTLFYFQDIKQAEEFATKLCKCGIFCEWKHNYAVEVPNFRNMLIDTQEMIFSVAKQYSSYYQCDYSAKKRFAQMNVERCINYWNIVGGDNYHSLHEIHEMDNEDYWKKIGEELGSYSLMQAICNSENHFDQRKLYPALYQ